MKDLAALFVALGCADVETYIQSGNVVFRPGSVPAAKLAGRIESAILERFGHRVPVVTRTAGELETVARDHPLRTADTDPARLHVGFLAEAPDPARVAFLDPERSPGDAFVVRGREIYLCYAAGAAKTKFTKALSPPYGV